MSNGIDEHLLSAIPSLGVTKVVVDKTVNTPTFREFIKEIRYTDGEMLLRKC